MGLFSSDVEFYHDAGGQQPFSNVRDGVGKMFGRNDGIERSLVAGTLRVFPIKDFGALDVGEPYLVSCSENPNA